MTELIDYSKEYKIEAIPSKNNKELAEKGIGVYPGTMQYLTASWNDILKRYERTGFDENAPDILRLPTEKKVVVQKRVKEKREEIEAIAGLPEGFLKATSDAWISDLCIHQLELGQDLKVRVNGHNNTIRPFENYKDAILLALIMNNPRFPKSKEDLSKPEFKDARFYLTTDEEKSTLIRSSLTQKKQAYVALSNLFDDGKNKQRAWEVAYKLGLVNKQKVDAEALELRLHEAIFNDKTGKTLEDFLETCALDNEALIIYNIFQAGINLGVIRVDTSGNYHRGANTYRKTKQDSIDYLLAAGNEIQLAELRSEVEARKKKHMAIG